MPDLNECLTILSIENFCQQEVRENVLVRKAARKANKEFRTRETIIYAHLAVRVINYTQTQVLVLFARSIYSLWVRDTCFIDKNRFILKYPEHYPLLTRLWLSVSNRLT
jgi:hypothetical protein